MNELDVTQENDFIYNQTYKILLNHGPQLLTPSLYQYS